MLKGGCRKEKLPILKFQYLLFQRSPAHPSPNPFFAPENFLISGNEIEKD
jgi:hypothetical protein